MSINLPLVFSTRDKLFSMMVNHIGTKPVGDEFDRLVDDLYLALNRDYIKHSILYESCSCLIGKEISSQDMYEFCWRLAGNMDLLKTTSISPWKYQKTTEWAPVQVLKAVKTKTNSGEYAYEYFVRFLAGTACPMLVSKVWSSRVCSYISSKLGFSKPWKPNPYRDGLELVNLRFFVELDPDICKNKPGFHHIKCSGGLLEWNKTILQARAHVKPPCPLNFSHPCFTCPVGYDKCIAGVHPRTYVKMNCRKCMKETWCDPHRSELTCTVCGDMVSNGTST